MSDEISLFALMDSHLSKTRLNDGNNPSPSTTDMLLPTPPGPKLVIPDFFPGNSPMKDFLAEKISNTIKAKEKRRQKEEQRKIEEEMENLAIREEMQCRIEEQLKSLRIKDQKQLSKVEGADKMKKPHKSDHIIDLTTAIIHQPRSNETKVQPLVPLAVSTKSHRPRPLKAQVIPDLPLRWDKETCRYKPWNPNLPCTTDVSFILKQKIKRGKCSNFGKVLCSRVRPVRHIAIPYEIPEFDSNIVRFDFKTKSPCDIYKENQRKPKISTQWTVDILDYI